VAKFVNNVLRLTDRVFNFVGGERHVGTYDLKTPIVRVHDVGREAQLGEFEGIFGGLTSNLSTYFTINVDIAMGAGATTRSSIGIYRNQSTTWALATWDVPDGDKETVWVLRASMNMSGTSFDEAIVMLRTDPKAGAGVGNAPETLIFFSDVRGSLTWASGFIPALPTLNLIPHPLPISNKLLNNNPIEFVGVAGAGGNTYDFMLDCIRLPNGVLPPGMT